MILNLLDIDENLHVFDWFAPFLVHGLVGEVSVPIRSRKRMPVSIHDGLSEVSELYCVACLGIFSVNYERNIRVIRLKNLSFNDYSRIIGGRCILCVNAYLQN